MPAVLSDLILSDDIIAAGAQGTNRRLNSRVGRNDGYESINVVWAQTRREFEIGIVALPITAWQQIEALHEITEGGAYGFLLSDPKDSFVSNGVVSAVSGGGYQLQKRYRFGSSDRYKDRKITRPRAIDFSLTVGGTPLSPNAYALDVNTGQLTISGGVDIEQVAWSGSVYVPVHFAQDSIDWTVVRPGTGDRLLLEGPSILLQEIRE